MTMPTQVQYSKRDATLIILSGAIAFFAAGLYMPLLPTLATLLNAPIWVVTAVLMALPSILTIILMIPGAILADTTGRRKEIMIAIGVAGIFINLAHALCRTWQELVVVRLIAGIPGAFAGVGPALLAFITPPEKRGTYMALSAGIGAIASAVATAVSGTLAVRLGGIAPVIYLATAVSVLGPLLILPVRAPKVRLPTRFSRKEAAEVFGNKVILAIALSMAVYLLGWQMVYSAFPVIAQFQLGMPIEIFTLVFSVVSFMLGLGTLIWGPIIDRVGARKSLAIGLGLSAVATVAMWGSFLSIPLPLLTWVFTVLYYISTFGGVVGSPATMTIASRSIRLELMTIGITLMNIAIFIPAIASGFLAGGIMASLGTMAMILISAVLQTIGVIGVILSRHVKI